MMTTCSMLVVSGMKNETVALLARANDEMHNRRCTKYFPKQLLAVLSDG
jgi:hypothetical protein